MKPAIFLANPVIRKRLNARGALRVLRSVRSEALSPADQGFLKLAMEVFAKDAQGRSLTSSE